MVAGRDLCPETGYAQRGAPSFPCSRKLQGTTKVKFTPKTGHEDPEAE